MKCIDGNFNSKCISGNLMIYRYCWYIFICIYFAGIFTITILIYIYTEFCFGLWVHYFFHSYEPDRCYYLESGKRNN